MMEKIINIINGAGADAWELTDTKTSAWEFYFIGHKLDQNRAKNVEHINLKVLKKSPDGETVGVASADISPTESEEEIRKTAENLVYQASLVRNKPYTLNKPKAYEAVKEAVPAIASDAEAFLKAMDSVAETETEDINSYEIFVNRHVRRFMNSEGIDITEEYPEAMLDLVVNARRDGHETELYRLWKFGSCDGSQLKQDIEELLKFGRDRLAAQPTPNLGKAAVVLSTDAALEVYAYFLDNLNAAYVIRGMSSFEIGKPLLSEFEGDRVTLRALRVLPGSPKNFACDPEGAPVRDAVLMEDGIPREYTGSRMFSQYLGLEDAFSVTNWSVSGGTKTADEIRSGEFLEIVEFSDFQVDSMTGDIFGEIRLAYYHDGKGTVTPVTGGSVSGSMLDNIGRMYMTKKTRRFANAEIPEAVRLGCVTIAGCEINE